MEDNLTSADPLSYTTKRNIIIFPNTENGYADVFKFFRSTCKYDNCTYRLTGQNFITLQLNNIETARESSIIFTRSLKIARKSRVKITPIFTPKYCDHLTKKKDFLFIAAKNASADEKLGSIIGLPSFPG